MGQNYVCNAFITLFDDNYGQERTTTVSNCVNNNKPERKAHQRNDIKLTRTAAV